MDKLIKGTIVSLVATALFATSLFVAAMPLSHLFEKAGFSVSWDGNNKTVTIEKPVAATTQAQCTTAIVSHIGDGYILADTENLGTVCIMVDYSSGNNLSGVTSGSKLEVHFDKVNANASTPYIYANKIVIK